MFLIVIPGYDDPHRLEFVLAGLIGQTDSDFEIHLVNDGGDTRLQDIFHQNFPRGHYTYMGPRSSRFRAGAARNLGAAVCEDNGRILFLDQDVVLQRDAVSIHKSYGNSPVIVCGVRRRIEGVPRRLAELSSWPQTGDDRFRRDGWRSDRYPYALDMCRSGRFYPELCHGFQISYPAAAFRALGGFWDEMTISEDQELAMRAVRLGCSTILDPRAIGYHIEHPLRCGSDERAKMRLLLQRSEEMPGVVRNGV